MMMISARDSIRQDNQSYHLAQSTEISHAAICGYKFKLPKIMGAVPEQEEDEESYISGAIAHKVLESAIAETLHELLANNATIEQIMDTWQPYIESIFENERVGCYHQQEQQEQELDIERYLSITYRRLSGIAAVLQEKIREDPIPNRILTL
jgi:hypothetical protein